jgi:hypothetical protein
MHYHQCEERPSFPAGRYQSKKPLAQSQAWQKQLRRDYIEADLCSWKKSASA